MDNQIINYAKDLAAKKHISLSKMVENYFKSIINFKINNASKKSKISNLKGWYKINYNIDDNKILIKALKNRYL